MKWGFLLCLFSLNLCFFPAGFASANADLFEKSQTTFQLHDGTTLRFYFPEQNKELQQWIDEQTETIFKTNIGLALCHQVFGSSVNLLQDHLAISTPAAQRIALNCANWDLPHLFIDNHRVYGPMKMTKSEAFQKRHYQFLLSENTNWPFDSWTDASTNQTILLTQWPHTYNSDSFLRMMAHEFAIYFDAQYYVGSPDWWAIHADQKFQIITANQDRLFLAVNNPVIASILAYMRAFRVEHEIIEQIRNGQNELDYLFAAQPLPFLDLRCGHDCLMNFVKAQSFALSPYSLALTAYSGSYKEQKIEAVGRESAMFSGHASLLSSSVEQYSRRFIRRTKYSTMPFVALMESMGPWQYKHHQNRVQTLFENVILPQDFEVLDAARVYLPETRRTISFLQWILQPVLSGRNVDFSSGPRPRIRTGGGGYGQ